MKSSSYALLLFLCIAFVLLTPICAFYSAIATPFSCWQVASPASSSSTRLNNFFQKFSEAFSNDQTLSPDKASGSVEYGEDDNYSSTAAAVRRSRSRGTVSAPVDPSLLVGTDWAIDLYLLGIPDRDPSSDLYGAKVNISTRDKALGGEVPDDSTGSFVVTFLEDGVCRVSTSDYTTGENGLWKVDKQYLRIAIETNGYKRTIATRGTLTTAYGGENTLRSTYSIPSGTVYLDCTIGYGSPGELLIPAPRTNGSDCVVRIEVQQGLLGVSSKMVPCGKFAASLIQ